MHFHGFRLVAVLAILVLVFGQFVVIPGSSAQTVPPTIVVQVRDQFGVWYNGVTVQVWNESPVLESSGATVNGIWQSDTLPTNSVYTVIVYSSTSTASQNVSITTNDALISFTLPRPVPPQVALIGVKTTPSIISPGEVFQAQFEIASVNNMTAYGALLNIQGSSQISVRSSGSVIPVGNLYPSNPVFSDVSFFVSPTAPEGSYQVRYSINFTDSTGNNYGTSGQFGVSVSGSPIAPSLDVQSFALSPSIVTPGNSFSISVDIGNFGVGSAYRSRMAINASAPLSVLGSAGTVSMGTIEAGNQSSFDIPLYASSSAKTGSYPLSISMTYFDAAGAQYNTTNVINIVLSGIPQLAVRTFEPSGGFLRPGSNVLLGVQLVNLGGDKAVGIAMVLTGPENFVADSTSYLGSILPGSLANTSFFVQVPSTAATGSYNFTLAMTYSDSANHVYSTTSVYTLPVVPYVPPAVSVSNVLMNPPVLSPGAQGTMTIFTDNNGNSAANNISISILGGAGLLASNYLTIGSLAPGAQSTSVVGVNVNGNAHPGNYTLYIHISYTDPSGKTYNSTSALQMNVYAVTSIFSPLNIGIAVVAVVVILAGFISLKKFRVI